MAVIYILKSEVNNRYYIGSTNNLERRLYEHNNGHSKYTRLTKPFKLMFSKEYQELTEARLVERSLKKLKSRIIIEDIIKSGKIKLRALSSAG